MIEIDFLISFVVSFFALLCYDAVDINESILFMNKNSSVMPTTATLLGPSCCNGRSRNNHITASVFSSSFRQIDIINRTVLLATSCAANITPITVDIAIMT